MWEVVIAAVLSFILCRINRRVHLLQLEGVELWFLVFIVLIFSILLGEGFYYLRG